MSKNKWTNWIGRLIFLIFLGLVAFFSYTSARSFTRSWSATGLGGEGGFFFQRPTPTPELEENPRSSETLAEPTPLPEGEDYPTWDGVERVTILVMGLDFRDWEEERSAPRTDTMIVLSLDPLTKTGGMLSIPRDLYVNIPGFEPNRINTAYRFGELYELPGGGPGLAMETVEHLIGVPIDFYAQIEFGAFERFIDEIGGLKLEIPYEIEVDPIGDNNNKTLQPGRQTLPGPLALAYARSRKTEGGDFDRAQRQQQVILAIRDRILSFDLIPVLISKAPILYQELSSGVNTNMTLDQVIRLGLLGRDIPLENIRRGIINEEHIVFFTTPEGDQVLKPLPDRIRVLRDEVFSTFNLSSPLAELTPAERMKAEGANLAVYNGTLTSRLASRTAEYLVQQGAVIAEENIGDSPQAFPYTTIIDHTGNPYTLEYLTELMEVSFNNIRFDYNPGSPVDVEVHLGADWAASNGLP